MGLKMILKLEYNGPIEARSQKRVVTMFGPIKEEEVEQAIKEVAAEYTNVYEYVVIDFCEIILAVPNNGKVRIDKFSPSTS